MRKYTFEDSVLNIDGQGDPGSAFRCEYDA